MERCSTSQSIGGMKIKTTVRCHLHPSGRPLSKRKDKTSAGEDGERDPFALLVGMQMGAATMKTVGGPQKIKHRITTRSSNSILGYVPRRTKTRDSREIFAHPHSQQHYSQQPKGGSNPGLSPRVTEKRWSISTHWNITEF